MSAFEDRMRATAGALAQVITDDDLPPLRLGPPRRGWRPARSRLAQRASGWLTPLAAAVAVLVVIAGGLAIGSRIPAGRSAGRPPVNLLREVPPYYVYLDQNNGIAEVDATVSGRGLATVIPPQPYLEFVQAAAAPGNEAFVLAAWSRFSPKEGSEQFFLLHFDPRNNTTRLTPLLAHPISENNYNVALSPDGAKLAISPAAGSPGQAAITVFTLATGASHRWVNFAPKSRFPAISWSGEILDYILQGPISAGRQTNEFGTLDTTAAWGTQPSPTAITEKAASGVVSLIPGSALLYQPPGGVGVSPPVTEKLSEVTMPGGQPLSKPDLATPPGPVIRVCWVSTAGSILIAEIAKPIYPAGHNLSYISFGLYVISDHGYLLLPNSLSTLPGQQSQFAW